MDSLLLYLLLHIGAAFFRLLEVATFSLDQAIGVQVEFQQENVVLAELELINPAIVHSDDLATACEGASGYFGGGLAGFARLAQVTASLADAQFLIV